MNMKRNAYSCLSCGKTIITEDQDEGVTPFMVSCRVTPRCAGMMQSHFYRGPEVESGRPVAFIWRKPTKREYKRSSPAMRQHFDDGGLNIYPARAQSRGGNG